jgi:acetyl-CoA carboxylase carboxyl transferase subunit alpha
MEMAQLRVPIVSCVIGEGASGGAIGIGLSDRVFMMENTWYSVISPESCSSILWRSWDQKERAAEELHLTAEDMLRFGIIDGIIKEPLGGAHSEPEEMVKRLKKQLKKTIAELQAIPVDQLVEQRIEKYDNIGVYREGETIQYHSAHAEMPTGPTTPVEAEVQSADQQADPSSQPAKKQAKKETTSS